VPSWLATVATYLAARDLDAGDAALRDAYDAATELLAHFGSPGAPTA
jgi:hypothetical protein